MLTNKTYRIKTETGISSNIAINLEQDYNTFEVLSLKIGNSESYRLHNADYGVIVGRVLANNGFGVENAKVSIFISASADTFNDVVLHELYPYASVSSTNSEGVRYNLLSDEELDDCHQVVGTFPQKTYLLDNDAIIEVFDTYYKYTARTNHAGDYMLCGVPVGTYTLHMDLDLSDCGILSQRPRDFVYKGYTIEQFENPNQFKTGTDIDTLSQIFSQNTTVTVNPFWGSGDEGNTIGLTRNDFKISFKFEPTAVFMGSIVGDNASNGISQKCVPTENMGAMDELVTGEGTIEMIRKTPDNTVEEFQVKGTQLINGDGVWCYQIPMNLDFVKHDEYGNIVPTNNPNEGIPTRARVRMRVSMNDFETNTENFFRAKVLIPHNPKDTSELDYNFGTATKEKSYRDLYWNNVYTVKSYIPRFQKSQNFKETKFTGIKHCNIYGQNNPMPYNNIRIKLPLMFTILCALIKSYIRVVDFVNRVFRFIAVVCDKIAGNRWTGDKFDGYMLDQVLALRFIVLADGLCPDLDGWYFAPCKNGNFSDSINNTPYNLLKQTFDSIKDGSTYDEKSKDISNNDTDNICLTMKTDYLVSCVEMNLAQEYKVINFDFYNDWINGTIYMPRWRRFVRKKNKFLFGTISVKGAFKGCMSADSDGLNPKGIETGVKVKGFLQTRRYTQQCKLNYRIEGGKLPTVNTAKGCNPDKNDKQQCHKKFGMGQKDIFGKENGGVVHAHKNLKDQFVYYFKPCEWENTKTSTNKVNLFANDLVLLGSLNDCSIYGLPQAFKFLSSSSFKMPTNLALTNMEDEGYLYTKDGNTVCSGKQNLGEGNGVKRLDGISQTFANTKKALGSTENKIEYSDSEDYVPMTESAGIVWNYSGPDQGKEDFVENFYQPGGHFLGMSCVNSETNVKSCINLQRICEEGVTMSQRHEVLRGKVYNPSEGNYNLSYKYLVPTGLISNDEIMGGDFRTMFATMNKKRLLAGENSDDRTGYKKYDFEYVRPNAFDGTFQWARTQSQYNKKLSIGTDFVVEDNARDERGNKMFNADPFEADDIRNHTYRRTIETQSEDYYKFRMGLDTLSAAEQETKFYQNKNEYSLPQYDNSFYFYFGLHHGSTALDELNKEFFSTCKTKNLTDINDN